MSQDNHSKDYLVSIMFSHYDSNNNGNLEATELNEVQHSTIVPTIITLSRNIFCWGQIHLRLIRVSSLILIKFAPKKRQISTRDRTPTEINKENWQFQLAALLLY